MLDHRDSQDQLNLKSLSMPDPYMNMINN